MVLALIQTVDCTDIVHGLDLKVFSSCKAIGFVFYSVGVEYTRSFTSDFVKVECIFIYLQFLWYLLFLIKQVVIRVGF